MKLKLLVSVVSLFSVMAWTAVAQNATSNKSEDRIVREVRHELLMLPYYGVFDNIAYKVQGGTVTLLGQVVRPSLKSDAENSIKHIEGIDHVDNQIEVLPPSSQDDAIRIALFRAIYQYPALQNGRVTLEGVVDSQADKDLAGIRAKSVPGTFEVTNNLQVQQP